MKQTSQLPKRYMETASSESYNRLQEQPIFIGKLDPYENLANAIICVAADDYKEAVKYDDEELLADVRSFFFSEWFTTLSDISPIKLVRKLNDEIHKEMTTKAV